MSEIAEARQWAQAKLDRAESDLKDAGYHASPGSLAAARLILRFTDPRPVAELDAMPPLSGAVGPNGEEAVVLWWHNDPGARLTALVKNEDGFWRFLTGLDPAEFKSNLERYELRPLQ